MSTSHDFDTNISLNHPTNQDRERRAEHMQVNETRGAQLMRGLVKTIFIGCYIAFMWASIHHVASFFNDFEADNGNAVGSYLLAGAFDITALVTTIGVMFFRKSMPTWVFWIVWAFILAIAAYSFFINWEYASHYQNMALLLQPTGETTAAYDPQGVLHYVPVMRVNTNLLGVNPVLASGFTIFSLVYSVIAEFFGTKAPTTEELLAKKKYLEETASIIEDIKKLEGKDKETSLIDRLKKSALEVKSAVKEVMQSEDQEEVTQSDDELSTQDEETVQSQSDEPSTQDEHEDQNSDQSEGRAQMKDGETSHANDQWGSLNGRSTVSIEKAAAFLNVSINTIVTLRNKGTLKTAALNKQLITVASLKAYDLKRSHRKQSRRIEESKPQLKVVNR
jgi:hypothetical protein